MKLTIIAICMVSSIGYAACPEGQVQTSVGCFKPEAACSVKICSKMSRVSLDIWKHIKDSMNETCSTSELPAAVAQDGKVLGKGRLESQSPRL